MLGRLLLRSLSTAPCSECRPVSAPLRHQATTKWMAPWRCSTVGHCHHAIHGNCSGLRGLRKLCSRVRSPAICASSHQRDVPPLEARSQQLLEMEVMEIPVRGVSFEDRQVRLPCADLCILAASSTGSHELYIWLAFCRGEDCSCRHCCAVLHTYTHTHTHTHTHTQGSTSATCQIGGA